MKDRFLKLKRDIEKLIDQLDAANILAPIELLEEAQQMVEDAMGEYEEYQ